MFPKKQLTETSPHKAQWFTATHWSVVLAAAQSESPETEAALETLCRTYWYPLYAYARQRGTGSHDAQDLTQEFFARLLEGKFLGQADREKGKFRSFLLGAFKHFLAESHDRATAAKRGGGVPLISLDDEAAEDRYLHEPVTDLSPDRIFERQWAVALMEQALARLKEEFIAKDKLETFNALKIFLSGEAGSGDYAPLAAKMGISASAIAVMVHRLRQRYREVVRAEIAHTVAGPAAVEDEMRHLFAALTQ